MKYLNDHIEELCNGRKIAYRGKVYWMNDVTMEIYAHSLESEVYQSISGYKVADVTDNFVVVASK